MSQQIPTSSHPPWLAIALLSCAALAYEILLTRLFSMVHWSSLVGLIISLALLGYGASGTLLSLLRTRLATKFERFFTLNALLFGLTAIGAFQLAQQLPLNPVELAWNPRHIIYLAGIYLLLAIPFFNVANAIGLALASYRDCINRIYAADLVGAGAGAAGIVGLLFLLPADKALLWIALAGPLSGTIAAVEQHSRHRKVYILVSLACILGLLLSPAQWRQSTPAAYKDISQALAATGAVVLEQQSNPLGITTIVDNRVAPLRYAPGLSLASPRSPPAQAAIFSDGDFTGSLYRSDSASGHLVYLSSALPYALLQNPRVLLVGAHDTTATNQAIAMGATRIDLVEPNPFLLELLNRQLSAQTADTRVVLHQGAFRQYLLADERTYDLIHLSAADGVGDTSGLRAQRENYLYTVESISHCIQRLTPGGLLSFTRGLHLPPRDSLKSADIAIQALQQLGIADPARHLGVIRSWNTVTLLIASRPLTPPQLENIRKFSSKRMFDLVYLPDIRPNELNRYHLLDAPYFHQGIQALLSEEREAFLAQFRFDIKAPTDNRPFFSRFTRLGDIGELYRQPGKTGLAHIDWGVGLLLIALLLALMTSTLLILLPLWLWKTPFTSSPVRTFIYFGAIGLAFLFIEIAFIQQLNLFLGNPLYATATVLGGFLAFAGIGSYLSRHLSQALGNRTALLIILAIIVIVTALTLWLLPHLLEKLAATGTSMRVLASLLLQAPIAMAMGMPFPIGMEATARQNPEQIPWAWGINGCASVISALLAVLLAMEIGFSGVMLTAIVLYTIAFISFPATSGGQ